MMTVTLTLELNDQDAWALAQLVKRLGWQSPQRSRGQHGRSRTHEKRDSGFTNRIVTEGVFTSLTPGPARGHF
jgi:hypothetical protein